MIRALTIATVCVCFAGTLAAQEIEFRAVGGWGWGTTSPALGVDDEGAVDLDNPYSGGVGGSAGFVLPMGGRTLFVGGRVVHHLGQEFEFQFPNAPTVMSDLTATFFAGEIGITWQSAPVMVRTSANVGAVRFSSDVTAGGQALALPDQTEFAVGPSLLVAVPLGRTSFVGLEGAYWSVADAPDAFVVYGTLGISLGRR
jgi:hypothetical protein